MSYEEEDTCHMNLKCTLVTDAGTLSLAFLKTLFMADLIAAFHSPRPAMSCDRSSSFPSPSPVSPSLPPSDYTEVTYTSVQTVGLDVAVT
jgi:hypothetical protein